jgi:hypothetical protein
MGDGPICPSCARPAPQIPWHCDCGYVVFRCPRCVGAGALAGGEHGEVPLRCPNCGGYGHLATRPAGRAPTPPVRR